LCCLCICALHALSPIATKAVARRRLECFCVRFGP
jgi:hypothetical protein